eukprot:476898-Amphidinium_carterae.1
MTMGWIALWVQQRVKPQWVRPEGQGQASKPSQKEGVTAQPEKEEAQPEKEKEQPEKEKEQPEKEKEQPEKDNQWANQKTRYFAGQSASLKFLASGEDFLMLDDRDYTVTTANLISARVAEVP